MTNSTASGHRTDLPGRSPFVGRNEELKHLRAAWERAVQGERQIVFISGEPGIGKTRLALELAEHIREQHASVLLGRCDEEALIAYQPFVEALRGQFARSPEDFSNARLGSLVADLARLLPELSTRRRLLESRARGDPEAERYRLFEAVAAFLEGVAQDRPTLLVLDDLQWADHASLLLLRHVIRSPRSARLLLLGTYRDTDLRRGHPLTHLLADLRRARAFQRTVMAGLRACL